MYTSKQASDFVREHQGQTRGSIVQYMKGLNFLDWDTKRANGAVNSAKREHLIEYRNGKFYPAMPARNMADSEEQRGHEY